MHLSYDYIISNSTETLHTYKRYLSEDDPLYDWVNHTKNFFLTAYIIKVEFSLKNQLTLKMYMLCGTTGCLNPADLATACNKEKRFGW